MNTELENKIKLVMKEYNAFIENLSYEKDVFSDDIAKDEKAWNKTAIEALDGKTPADYLNELSETQSDALREIYEFVANESYFGIPSFIKKIFTSHKKETEQILLDILTENEKFIAEGEVENIENGDFEQFDLFIITVRNSIELGGAKVEKKVVEMFKNASENEQIIDAFEVAFKKMKTEKLLKLLENENNEFSEEKIATIAQVVVSSGEKSEEVYQGLKKAFKNSETKELFASFLGDYGDGRAVTILRKELANMVDMYRHTDKDSENGKIIFRIMMMYNKVITDLGGTTKDIIG